MHLADCPFFGFHHLSPVAFQSSDSNRSIASFNLA
jgi:hypothetical protein